MVVAGFLFSKTFFFTLSLLATTWVTIDVNRNGSLAHSKTGQMLKDAGYLESVQLGLKKIEPYTTTVKESYLKNVAPIVDPYLNVVRRKIPGWQRQFKHYSDKVTREATAFYNFLKAETPKYFENVSSTVNHYSKIVQKEFTTGSLSVENLKASFNYYSKQAVRHFDEGKKWASSKIASLVN